MRMFESQDSGRELSTFPSSIWIHDLLNRFACSVTVMLEDILCQEVLDLNVANLVANWRIVSAEVDKQE